VAGGRSLELAETLIELLNDDEEIVRDAARRSLIRLSQGKDFGPRADASEMDRKKSMQQWRDWLATHDSR
jgi:hypothetical protein